MKKIEHRFHPSLGNKYGNENTHIFYVTSALVIFVMFFSFLRSAVEPWKFPNENFHVAWYFNGITTITRVLIYGGLRIATPTWVSLVSQKLSLWRVIALEIISFFGILLEKCHEKCFF